MSIPEGVIQKYVAGDSTVRLDQVISELDAIGGKKIEWEGRSVAGKVNQLIQDVVYIIKDLFSNSAAKAAKQHKSFDELIKHSKKRMEAYDEVVTHFKLVQGQVATLDKGGGNELKSKLERLRDVVIIINNVTKDPESQKLKNEINSLLSKIGKRKEKFEGTEEIREKHHKQFASFEKEREEATKPEEQEKRKVDFREAYGRNLASREERQRHIPAQGSISTKAQMKDKAALLEKSFLVNEVNKLLRLVKAVKTPKGNTYLTSSLGQKWGRFSDDNNEFSILEAGFKRLEKESDKQKYLKNVDIGDLSKNTSDLLDWIEKAFSQKVEKSFGGNIQEFPEVYKAVQALRGKVK